jgi:hypothetical protein
MSTGFPIYIEGLRNLLPSVEGKYRNGQHGKLLPPPPHKLDRRHTGRDLLTRGGKGEEPNHTTARSMALYK